MNDCLKKPCSGSGYFHFDGKAIIDLDHTGVFRYVSTSVLYVTASDPEDFSYCNKYS